MAKSACPPAASGGVLRSAGSGCVWRTKLCSVERVGCGAGYGPDRDSAGGGPESLEARGSSLRNCLIKRVGDPRFAGARPASAAPEHRRLPAQRVARWSVGAAANWCGLCNSQAAIGPRTAAGLPPRQKIGCNPDCRCRRPDRSLPRAPLLRRHVLQRSQQGAACRLNVLGGLRKGRRIQALRQTQIQHLRVHDSLVPIQHDVGRLEIAVDDLQSMGVFQRSAPHRESSGPPPARGSCPRLTSWLMVRPSMYSCTSSVSPRTRASLRQRTIQG